MHSHPPPPPAPPRTNWWQFTPILSLGQLLLAVLLHACQHLLADNATGAQGLSSLLACCILSACAQQLKAIVAPALATCWPAASCVRAGSS